MPWKYTNHHEKLTFCNEIQILSIEYNQDKEGNHDNAYKLPLTLAANKNLRFEWLIDDALLDEIKHAYVGQIFWSKLFGDNGDFALYLAPNGTEPIYEGDVILDNKH